jgi:hypothetical protein
MRRKALRKKSRTGLINILACEKSEPKYGLKPA